MMRGMRHVFRRFAGVLAALCLLAALIPAAGAAESDDSRIIRVGLYYGSGVLPTANLDNVDGYGTGHRFGYFQEDGSFVQLGYTAEEQISMLKSTNIYLTSSGTYATEPSSGDAGVVGCYHLQLPGSYADFDTARAAADALSRGFVAWINGTYYVRWGSFTTSEEAQSAMAELQTELSALGQSGDGLSVCWTSRYGVTVTHTRTTQILFQFDGETEDLALGVMPDLTGAANVQTWFKNFKYHGGFRYQRIGGGDLTVVNMVPLETYVKGVIPYEMSGSWPLEALKAQAVAARTYVINGLNGHSSYNFDICNTAHCQVYYGEGNNTSRAPSATSDQAVDETQGVLLWYDGKLASTNFSSSNGGGSESAVNVWGRDYPYLMGKLDPYETSIADIIPSYEWTVTFTADELTQTLRDKGYGNSQIVDLEITARTETGNVLEIRFTDAAGRTYTFSRDKTRTLLGLRSMRYDIVSGGSASVQYHINGETTVDSLSGLYAISGNGAVSAVSADQVYAISGGGDTSRLPAAGGTGAGEFVLSGTGYGHHVGMSQWGAYAMAKQGLTYEDILLFYYTGTYLAPME